MVAILGFYFFKSNWRPLVYGLLEAFVSELNSLFQRELSTLSSRSQLIHKDYLLI